MKRAIDKLAGGQYDVLVIGGGINGAAIAHLSARQQLRTVLLEKGDFASGTSSKSTKLVHGGIRYLETFEFGLVREALHERAVQLRAAPHLVKPLAFTIPIYQDDPRPLWMLKAGVMLYDALCGKALIKKHQFLTADEVMKTVPGIMSQGLRGGIVYYDAQMDDARLCLENVLMADKLGAHVANYVEAKAFVKENGKTVGVQAKDMITGREFVVRGKHVICAVGPWADKFLKMDHGQVPQRVRTTKGAHIIYKERLTEQALLIQTHQDKRVFFVIPWGDHALIGTTDTDYKQSPDGVRADQEDIDYLLRETRRVFPDKHIKASDIVYTFAGLRPLVFKEGLPSKVSRNHVIERSYSGIYFVMGGKYTTYRKIAEDVLKKIISSKDVKGAQAFSLYGSETGGRASDSLSSSRVSQEVTRYLKNVYGARYKDVLALIEKDPSLSERMCACSPAIKAQAVYAIEQEMALRPEDIFERRLSLVYGGCAKGECLKYIQSLFPQA